MHAPIAAHAGQHHTAHSAALPSIGSDPHRIPTSTTCTHSGRDPPITHDPTVLRCPASYMRMCAAGVSSHYLRAVDLCTTKVRWLLSVELSVVLRLYVADSDVIIITKLIHALSGAVAPPRLIVQDVELRLEPAPHDPVVALFILGPPLCRVVREPENLVV